MAPPRRTNYKRYFRNEDGTPTTIPRRTVFRQIRKTKLEEKFKQSVRDSAGSTSSSFNQDQTSATTPGLREHDTGYQPQDETFHFSSSETDSEVDEQEKREYSLLFEGARISRDESIRLIYTFAIRHKLTKSGIADLLVLLNFHLPSNVNIPSTNFLLEKATESDFSLAMKYYYCPNCETSVESNAERCPRCEASVFKNDLMKSGSFFIMFNLESSLSKLLAIPTVNENLRLAFHKRWSRRNETSVLEDITDGKMYKELQLGRNDFTCSINTDGVSIFNSSKSSIWPILLSINELDYKFRRKHTILGGLWFGPNKPSFDTFLRPQVLQCNKLSNDGIQWKADKRIVKSKIIFPIVAADSVARCALQGIKQFNGLYGCPWCLSKGETLRQDERKHKWIFPPCPFVKRTKESFIQHLQVLEGNLENSEENNCFGVKSASQFLLLTQFDIVNGFTFDYMHTCLLGVLRNFTNCWFDSRNHEKEYYLGLKQDQISNTYLRCKVPPECSRVTRHLKDMAYWKANEWKSWLLLCIPLLQSCLKQQYLKHFAKFVNAMCILISWRVSIEELDFAEGLLKEFCDNAPTLYGPEICTFNMHILLHAADCVRNWGPLWCYSLFQFEHHNGVLVKYFSGTRQICMQIVKKVVLTTQIRCTGTTGFKNKFAKNFLNPLLTIENITQNRSNVIV